MMIAQHYDSIHFEDHLLRQINIKEHQLKIAREFNMPYAAKVLQRQLLELESQLSQLQNPQFEALMSLLDD